MTAAGIDKSAEKTVCVCVCVCVFMFGAHFYVV
jgi:hypothetical protein